MAAFAIGDDGSLTLLGEFSGAPSIGTSGLAQDKEGSPLVALGNPLHTEVRAGRDVTNGSGGRQRSVKLWSAFAGRVFGRRRRALVCRDAVELMTEYLEGAMSPEEHARFEAHLAQCDACTAYLDQMRATIATLGHLPADHLPDVVVDELVDLYRRHRAS